MTFLRYKADRRAVGFMIFTSLVFYFGWTAPTFSWGLFFLACFMANIVYVMVHNHLHIPIFKPYILNRLTDYWLTLFYGYPVFAWISTHVMNHHVLGNKPGDDSATWQHSEKNNLFTFLAYPTVSGGAQQKVNIRFVKALWFKDRKRALYYISQLVVLLAFNITMLVIDWKRALLFVIIPQQISLNFVLFVNYMQHVHADEQSRWDHSRNFVGKIENWFMMNNGFHTIHHEKPLQHWSLNAKGHEAIASKISPQLFEPNIIHYVVKTYFLAPFFKSLRVESMRLKRMEREAQMNASTPSSALPTDSSLALN